MDNEELHINTENTTDSNEKSEKIENSVLAYLHDLVVLVVSMFLVFSLVFRVVIVSGPSMKNTLFDGDWLLVFNNTLYTQPKQGDIVVISKKDFNDGTPIIKRVIATQNQTVDIDFTAGIVYVDGAALDEPYTLTPTNLFEGVSFPLVVPEGCVFVLGDNRNGSKDSRSNEIGMIDTREIIGKAFLLIFPGTDDGRQKPDYNRIGVVS